MKRSCPAAFLALILCLGSTLLRAQAPAETAASTPPATKGQRIDASHHSYFVGISALIDEVAKSAGITDEQIVGDDYIGGSKAMQHWVLLDEKNQAKTALKDGKVDVLMLTPVYLPDDGIEKFADFGLQFNPNLRVTVMEFWIPFDAYNPTIYDKNYKPVAGEPPLTPKPAKVDHNAATPKSLDKECSYYIQTMDALVTDLNKKFGKQVVYVVPVGQAVVALRKKIIAGEAPGIKTQEDIFKDQLGHPKPPIQLLEAYGHFAVIYHKTPVGLPMPSVLAKDKDIPEADKPALNTLLQQLTWDAVTHHPLSGVTP